ncbi:hypothetical protein QQP08_015162 [Theobroma cacao]|nr:hypothetical protein QQP08_015162 [Theobroma cacao]
MSKINLISFALTLSIHSLFSLTKKLLITLMS